MKYILIVIVGAYQILLSPFLGKNCRYLPTCSEYAKEALEKCGAFRGSWLIFWRLLRCNPFCKAKYDPVPEKNDSK